MKFKSILIAAAILAVGLTVFAQSDSSRYAYNIHFGNMDYSGDYSTKFDKFNHGFNLGVGAATYLGPSFDLTGDLNYGRVKDINNTPVKNKDLWDSLQFKSRMGNLNIHLKYKFTNGYILKESSTLSPYLVAGIGLVYSKSTGIGYIGDFRDKPEKVFTANFNYGGGLKYQMNLHVGFFIQSIHMNLLNDRIDGWDPDIPANKKNDVFLMNSIGVVFTPQGSSTTQEQKEKLKEAQERK